MAATFRRFLNKSLLVLFLLVVLFFATGALFAQIVTRSGESIDAADILPDMAFLSARELTISAKSTDDIFAAGGDISINGAQADHLLAAGGDITVVNAAVHDLVLFGADATLVSGIATDDLVAAVGDLDIQADFKIGGSAVLSGGELTIAAPVGGELRAAGGRINLAANVEGDAHLVGEKVMIGPNVRIGGDLRHRAHEIVIDPTAVIVGEMVRLEPVRRPDLERWGAKAAAAAALFALAFLIGIGVLVVAIALALPALMNSSAAMIRNKPLSTLGVGFLISVAAPVVIVILLASLFGIPLALLIAVIYAAAAPLALAAFAYFVGIEGRRAISKGAGEPPGAFARALWTALAAGGLIVVAVIPLLGGLVWLLAYMVGIGAVMTRGGKALAVKA